MAISTRKLAYYSFFLTLATVLGLVEAMLPNPLPIPGVKLGLANTVTLIAIYLYGLKDGLALSVLRVIFVSLLLGTFLSVSFFLSMTGALASTLVMALFKRCIPAPSIIGVSIAGAVTHNMGQLLMAAVLIQTGYIFFYLPFLLLAAIPTGVVTGYIARLLLTYLKDRLNCSF